MCLLFRLNEVKKISDSRVYNACMMGLSIYKTTMATNLQNKSLIALLDFDSCTNWDIVLSENRTTYMFVNCFSILWHFNNEFIQIII